MGTKEWWAIHANAKKELTKIPGVVGVGLGIKEVKGQLSEQVALIVYVEKKLPRNQVSQEQMIPSTFQGMPTDVQRYQPGEPFGGTTLEGGMQIRRLPDSNDRPKPGTLGYVVTRTTDNQTVMLSCEHVMLFHRQDERSIFHPDVSRCCGKLKHKVGTAIDGKTGNFSVNSSAGTFDFAMDGALASIDSGIDARKFIPNVGSIVGSGDISASPTSSGSPTISVKKMGAASAFTQGTVDDVAYDLGPALRMMKIRPTATGGFPFTIRWQVPAADVAEHLTNYPAASLGGTATQVGPDQIEFHISTFALPGDSGSAVVDATGRIVGIIVTGGVYQLEAYKNGRLGTGIVPTGTGIACHIGPYLQELNIRIDPSTTTSAGTAVMMPGEEIFHQPDSVQQIHARLSSVERELDGMPEGRRLIELVRTHAEEVSNLVHHNRKVMVAWHRSQGPAFSNLYLKALMDPDSDLPREINGTTLLAARERMYQVLMNAGSPSLQDALKDNVDLVRGLIDSSRSIHELVEKTGRLPRKDDPACEEKLGSHAD
jgi:hypothetical protein